MDGKDNFTNSIVVDISDVVSTNIYRLNLIYSTLRVSLTERITSDIRYRPYGVNYEAELVTMAQQRSIL